MGIDLQRASHTYASSHASGSISLKTSRADRNESRLVRARSRALCAQPSHLAKCQSDFSFCCICESRRLNISPLAEECAAITFNRGERDVEESKKMFCMRRAIHLKVKAVNRAPQSITTVERRKRAEPGRLRADKPIGSGGTGGHASVSSVYSPAPWARTRRAISCLARCRKSGASLASVKASGSLELVSCGLWAPSRAEGSKLLTCFPPMDAINHGAGGVCTCVHYSLPGPGLPPRHFPPSARPFRCH